MMKRKLLILCFISVSLLAFAGDGEFAVAKIPIALLKNANAVVRIDEQVVKMKNLTDMLIQKRFVVTVMNEEGNKFAGFLEQYDKFNKIESIDGVLYDASGKKIKTLKKSEVKDYTALSEMTLAADGRIKEHNFFYKVYPYTVEYTIEERMNETMFFPSWNPLSDQNLSVEESSMTVIVPKDYVLRFKMINYSVDPLVKIDKEVKEYSWKVSNLEAIKEEDASPSLDEITPTVLIAPSDFQIEDFNGKMNDWAELGRFQASLNKDRDLLPPAIKEKVHELTDGVEKTEVKVERLYNFMQNNTRYVSIQFGIGGWRPLEAGFVASKGYGDCKALSNYMYALLKEASIPSYYTLIRAGRNEDDIIANFPSRQFNHAIICVPNKKDTIWLECTDQSIPAGYLGAFTCNRYALLVDEKGGKLVRTPKYGLKQNTLVRHINATINEEGTLETHLISRYNGLLQDEIYQIIHYLSKDKVKEYLREELDFATYEVNKFDYKENKSSVPEIVESLDITVSNYASITGKRLFVTPDIMTRSSLKFKADEERKCDIYFRFEYNHVDSVEIEIPTGYDLEAMPQDMTLSSKFGKYSSVIKLKDNKIYYYRNMEYYSGRFPAKDYPELVKFYDAAYKADRAKIVFVKKS